MNIKTLMWVVLVVVGLLNVLFAVFIIPMPEMEWYVEIGVSLPMACINAVSIFWFINGGRFSIRRKVTQQTGDNDEPTLS